MLDSHLSVVASIDNNLSDVCVQVQAKAARSPPSGRDKKGQVTQVSELPLRSSMLLRQGRKEDNDLVDAVQRSSNAPSSAAGEGRRTEEAEERNEASKGIVSLYPRVARSIDNVCQEIDMSRIGEIDSATGPSRDRCRWSIKDDSSKENEGVGLERLRNPPALDSKHNHPIPMSSSTMDVAPLCVYVVTDNHTCLAVDANTDDDIKVTVIMDTGAATSLIG